MADENAPPTHLRPSAFNPRESAARMIVGPPQGFDGPSINEITPIGVSAANETGTKCKNTVPTIKAYTRNTTLNQNSRRLTF